VIDDAITSFLKALSPPSIDAELRSLGGGGLGMDLLLAEQRRLASGNDDHKRSSIDDTMLEMARREKQELMMFIDWATVAVQSRRNFEFVQAVLNLFLKVMRSLASLHMTMVR
jgi:hypothetical protein